MQWGFLLLELLNLLLILCKTKIHYVAIAETCFAQWDMHKMSAIACDLRLVYCYMSIKPFKYNFVFK